MDASTTTCGAKSDALSNDDERHIRQVSAPSPVFARRYNIPVFITLLRHAVNWPATDKHADVSPAAPVMAAVLYLRLTAINV